MFELSHFQNYKFEIVYLLCMLVEKMVRAVVVIVDRASFWLEIFRGPQKYHKQKYRETSCLFPRVHYGADLFALQMNFIELQLHYLNCGCITCNVSFCIAAKEILKIHVLKDVKTADLIKKKPYKPFKNFLFLPPNRCFNVCLA
jgi:hypothetical protein